MVDVARWTRRFALVPLLGLLLVAPADATTLVRKGLDQLAIENETVLQARILDVHSYWNADHTFILTDVRARASRVLKDLSPRREAERPDIDWSFTLLGGSVDGITVLVLGGADLAPGEEYVLFLNHSDLPGATSRLTIPGHAQGAFRIQGGRAISQALEEPLLPDATGSDEVPGGSRGIALDDLVRVIREHANR